MNCPICNHDDSYVLKTEPRAAGIRRRRQCTRCGHRFATFESLEDASGKLAEIRDLVRKAAQIAGA